MVLRRHKWCTQMTFSLRQKSAWTGHKKSRADLDTKDQASPLQCHLFVLHRPYSSIPAVGDVPTVM